MLDKHTLVVSQIQDAVRRVARRGHPKYLGFFDEQSGSVARALLRGAPDVSYRLWGGYAQAERTVLGIFASDAEISTEAFPIQPVCFTYRAQDGLTHRDFLGALMALGIERDTVGDIVVGNGKTTVFLHSNIADYCLSQISKIGSVGVHAQIAELTIDDIAPRFEEKSTTIASARLDNIVSALCNVSRSQAVQWIEDGLVMMDGIIVNKITKPLLGSCKLSVRGRGKFVVFEPEQQTRKGRWVLAYKKYI